jgi:hypothetical protein
VRIAVSSSTFRRPLAAAELTQLEWLEGCASSLAVDGVLADVADFPRRDAEYVAQLRKVAIDLGLVPFGLDAAGLLDPAAAAEHDAIFSIAVGFGAAVVRTTLPAPGDVPPAAFAAAVAAGKELGRAAKAANVTVVVAAAPGTLGEDLAGIKRLLKDVDSAWLRACPPALDPAAHGPKDRFPAFAATSSDDPRAVAERAAGWLILDALAPEAPWDVLAGAIGALRDAAARQRLGAGT